MSFIDDSIKNTKKQLLKEATATSAVGAFTGRGGQTIDKLFMGGFHPDFGELLNLLTKQVEDRLAKRAWVDNMSPELETAFKYLDIDYPYDKQPSKEDIAKLQRFINTSKTNQMQAIDLDIQYDEPVDMDKSHFINDSEDMMSVDPEDIGLRYDNVYSKSSEKFINDSEKNWRYIYHKNNEED